MNESTPNLEQIAARASALYSRPTVAMEIVRLVEQPRLDPAALKRCVEQDPALASKVLRVVNSSLFGLNRPVADLNQAIGLLGIKPLKMLVLGFSLPDALFSELAARELRWYWTNTLTRAVAARSICEQLWHQSSEEAFIAGLLHDVGILVLVRELGEPYAHFLAGAIGEHCSLAALEQDTLGFDHTQLSAALLSHWKLPNRLVEAIAAPKKLARLSRMTSPDGDLPQILHLADMLVRLVGTRQLDVLPDLLEAGKTYRGMTKSALAALVEALQPQVEQLAGVLSLELMDGCDYMNVLLEAHQRMAELSEDVAGMLPAGSSDDRAHARLLTSTMELTQAMRTFLAGGKQASSDSGPGRQWTAQHAAHEPASNEEAPNNLHVAQLTSAAGLLNKLRSAVNRCRERRRELSLLLAEPNVFDVHSDPQAIHAGRETRFALLQACSRFDQKDVSLISLDKERMAAILSNCDRRTAVALAQSAIDALSHTSSLEGGAADLETTLSVGVATASVVPRNFDPIRLVESAERCLTAARACGISAVKSIEV
jgi:HD-like signal output (HDOD) protein/GGDEF domain-containing protein